MHNIVIVVDVVVYDKFSSHITNEKLMSNNLWSIENFGVQNSREACHKRPQEFQVRIGDFRVEPVKGRRKLKIEMINLQKQNEHAFFFHLSLQTDFPCC